MGETQRDGEIERTTGGGGRGLERGKDGEENKKVMYDKKECSDKVQCYNKATENTK